MNVEKLLDHIQATYFNLRVGIGVMALLLPLLLWIGGKVLFGLPLQSSLSAYYHTDMGNVFVGVLFTIGTFLHLYKGYPIKTPFLSENRALDAAGICALGVALFPTDCPDGATCTGFTWGAVHGTFAVLVFFFLAYVCIFRARDTLDEAGGLDPDTVRKFIWLYWLLGALMVVLPIAAVILSNVLGRGHTTVFWVEFAAMWVFGIYWLAKSAELHKTRSDRSVMRAWADS